MTFGLVFTFMFTTLGFAQNQVQVAKSSKDDVKFSFETIFEAFTGTDDAHTDWVVVPTSDWTYDENHLKMENPESMQTQATAYSNGYMDASDYDNLELQFTQTLEDQDFSMGYALNVFLQISGEDDQHVYQQQIDQSFYDNYFYLDQYYSNETIDISDIAGGKQFSIKFVFGGYTGDVDFWEITDLKVVAEVEAETFVLTLNSEPEAGGTVEGSGEYQSGVDVSITASANDGYNFINWTDLTGDEVSSDSAFNYPMPAEDVTLTANFQEDTTSIEQITKEQINIYPNPANRQINIESDVMIEKALVLDNLGKTVYSANINAKKANIQTHELETGVYFLRIFTAEGDIAKKLLVK